MVTGLPRTGDRWFKNFRLPRKDYDCVFKTEFLAVKGEKGFSKLWVRDEFHNSLMIISKLITCEARFSTYKACHFCLLAHFEFGKLLNFPFYFWKSLSKMASQVRKNLEHPTHSLYHHGLIKMLVLAELKKQDRVWEQFVYELSNSHLKSSLGNELGEPCIPDLVDKSSSTNNSVHQNNYPHEPTVNSCKKPAPLHTN